MLQNIFPYLLRVSIFLASTTGNTTGFNLMMMMMMMMMMNCSCGTVDRRKAFSLISSQDTIARDTYHCESQTRRAGSEPAQNLSSGFVQ